MVRMTLVAGLVAMVASAAPAQRHRDRDGLPDLRPPVVVGEDSGPARVELGQLIEVRLPMQSGTGYSWSASPDNDSQMEFIDQSTLHPWGHAPMPGSGQVQRFTYRAIAPGEVTLRFVYRRPWEGGVPPAKTVAQRVFVGPWRR